MYTGMELYVIGSKISKPQLENTTILRCFNKATLDFHGQSLSNPEVNVMSKIVRDKKNMSPMVLLVHKWSYDKFIYLLNWIIWH